MALLPETPDILPAEWIYHGWADPDEPADDAPTEPEPTPEPDDLAPVAERIAGLGRP